ncbi:hypothetical protein H0H87_004763 [Tephrocybe sp. NHM501043]|nr:hypothetical protein H0H87_004763 [Tephrocybe sp. NHM501043]
MSSTADSLQGEYSEELKVTFYPQLYLQRRIWVLDVMRAEKITELLDIGCGEGQLLAVLCNPAPWLSPPPLHILPPFQENPCSPQDLPLSPTYNDEIPNIHPTRIIGLDISSNDLEFAVLNTAPQPEKDHNEGSDRFASRYTSVSMRWEDLDAQIWKGGLEVINEDFVDIECIVSTEVIEHLPPEIFPAFAPIILGVYHPRFFLVTTPSYTFNARFTAPMAPPSARKGYSDPTKRTDRVFRHSDHKFEWTADEFQRWCDDTATEWGYEVEVSSIGRSIEVDEWGRDAELGGATSVAVFRRCDMDGREQRGRKVLEALKLGSSPHELLVNYKHSAHESSEKPHPLDEIGLKIKAKMEEFREGFMRVEELWFERDIAVLCGGWIEILVRGVERSEFLVLKRDDEDVKGKRANWIVELVGSVNYPKEDWSKAGEASLDDIPFDWFPGDGEPESSEGEWGGSTDMEGDVSWNESEEEDDVEDSIRWPSYGSQWDTVEVNSEGSKLEGGTKRWADNDVSDVPTSGGISTAGWDGDESEDTS